MRFENERKKKIEISIEIEDPTPGKLAKFWTTIEEVEKYLEDVTRRLKKEMK